MKTVYIEKDNRNAIAISSDNHKGIVVQLVAYCDSLKSSSENPNEIINQRPVQLIQQWFVDVVPEVVNGNLVEFREAVRAKVELAKKELAKVRENHKKIDGILNDLQSQHKDLNK